MTLFLRVLEAEVDEKPQALKVALLSATNRFNVDPRVFAQVPGSPFAYWVTDTVLGLFALLPRFEGKQRTVKQGLVTTEDFRFVHAWWEVTESALNKRWFGFAKGGKFSPFYADIFLVVDWFDEGAQSWAIYAARKDVVGGIIKNPDCYFRAGLTWPRRTDGLSFRVMPSGCIFADKGPAAFVEGNSASDLLALCAIVNSQPFGYLVSVQLARTELAQSFEVGLDSADPGAGVLRYRS